MVIESIRFPVTTIPFGDGVVLLDEHRQRMVAVNMTGAIAWDLLAAGHDTSAIAAMLAKGFDVDESAVAPDVAGLIAQWRDAGLLGNAIERSPDAAAAPSPAVLASDPGDAFTCMIAGRRARLHLAEPATRVHVEGVLHPFAVPGDGAVDRAIDLLVANGAEPLVLRVDGAERMRLADPAEAIGAIFQQLLELAYPGTDWLAVIHGAAVVSPDGRAVLLPGAGGSGKSTLAAYLSRRGWRFLADDMITLAAPDGAVVPWPTPHSIKHGSWAALADLMPELGASPARPIRDRTIKFVAAPPDAWAQPPVPVSAIVFPRWSADPVRAGVRLPPLDTLARLLNDRIWLGYPLARPNVERFLAWLGSVPIGAAITYHTLAEAEALLDDVLG